MTRLLPFFALVCLLLAGCVFTSSPEPQTVTTLPSFDRSWDAPLIVILLGAFAGGAIFGLAACVPVLVRSRREIVRLKKEIRVHEKTAAASKEVAAAPALTAPDVSSTL